jgi:enediyne biosynthesis thioesterase
VPGDFDRQHDQVIVASRDGIELKAFDEIAVRMRLASMTQHRLELEFEYWRSAGSGDDLIARGRQGIACLRRQGDQLAPEAIPAELREALRPFATS